MPFAVAAEEKIDGRAVGDELVFLRSPCEPRAGELAQGRQEGQAGSQRAEGRSVRDVELHAAAILTRELLERRAEPGRAEDDAGQSFSFESSGELARVDPRCTAEFERPRRAATLREVRSFDEALPGVDDRRFHGRHVGGGQDPGKSGLLEGHPTTPALARR